MANSDFGPNGIGQQLSENLFVVSWLGMTPEQIDSHVYVLRGRNGLLLIDCGTPWGHERLRRNCLAHGLDPDDVHTILLTHGHVDHARGGYLFKRGGAQIMAHRAAAVLAESEWAVCLAAENANETYHVDAFLDQGGRRCCGFEIEVHATPGHTAGCLSYLIEVDGARCLFSGDLVMSNGLPGYRGDPGHSLAQIKDSLERLLKQDFVHLCHGHAALPGDGGRLFRQALDKAGSGEWEEA